MSFPVTAPYATWKTSAWSVEFVAPYGYASCQAIGLSAHRHFLLLAENAGCILQAIRKTNLMLNMEVKEPILKYNARGFLFCPIQVQTARQNLQGEL